MSDAIDPDDPETWPDPLRAALAPWVQVAEPGTYAESLTLPIADEQVLALLDGRPLRAYHCTRLLPHEVLSVRREGLLMLTREHIEDRIEAAHRAGALSAGDVERLRAGTVYAVEDKALRGREGQVCAVVGREVFLYGARGFLPLLSRWGGEAIYWHAEERMQARLNQVGKPSVVVLDLPLTEARPLMFLGLGRLLAGHLGDFPMRSADVFYKADLPASAVVDVWQPGNPEYDSYPDLPQT